MSTEGRNSEQRREEELRREAERTRTTGRTTDGVERGLEVDPTAGVQRRGSQGPLQGVAEGRVTRDDMRRAAKEAIIEREEELKGDGAYGSSTSDPVLPAALAEL
ncbi:MAG: hypothetical protein H0U04_19660, partial [Rubrobacter sp.]|nr:hypothetical protein [Rubrobacter sp.]